jgi:shikimate kinase
MTAGLPTIALVGLRASGKTAVGRALAKCLGRRFVDLDEEVVRMSASAKSTNVSDRGTEHRGAQPSSGGREAGADVGRSGIGAVYAELGETAFREVEQRALARVLAEDDAIVLATGGGVVERATNRDLLRERALVVWLRAPLTELQRRMRSDASLRPPLDGRDAVEEVPAVAARREPLYAGIAHLVIETDATTAEDAAGRIARDLAGTGRAGTAYPHTR